MGFRAARFLEHKCRERGWQVTFLDPKAWELPFLDTMYKEMQQPAAKFKQLHEMLAAADGYLLVTAEYNHSVPPALKNMLDHFQQEYLFKPSAIASYSAGSFGGVRAAEQLRLICAELGMPSISSVMPVPKVQDSFDEQGEPQHSNFHRYADRFLDEFAWYMEALQVQRAKGTPF
jgi:NAD(P)H-dependent FMN reductase